MFFSKKKKEYARVIDWSPAWDTGAPLPQVFSNGQKTYLTYLINESETNLDGTNLTMIDITSDTQYPLALVEFNGHTFRFGIANDEVLSGLPLYKKGLQAYDAHIIENSSWIEELKGIHRVHPYFNEKEWIDLKHFVLLFHDEIFEIIATAYQILTYKTTFETLAVEIAKRMNKK
ncbi:MAG: hypothetical protein CVU05_04695 [Bacteroidetes bacterium HGW-Bacteroidetes-21]|nr:MAG: hypothetical protein CVU05_04695 [Bacteroidetes bacterium HGW-Bacteroidetes-21]